MVMAGIVPKNKEGVEIFKCDILAKACDRSTVAFTVRHCKVVTG